MMTCWIMCTKKKCSSPSASIGELSASTTSPMPAQNDTCRTRGTGVPRRASVRDRFRYSAATISVGAIWSGSKLHGVSSEGDATAGQGSPRRVLGAP